MSEHATLSPSSTSRWKNCTGSVVASKDVPNTDSVYAAEGTLAHAVGAARLENKPGPAMPDKEQSDYVQQYVTAVRNAALGKILLVEQAVDVSNWTTEKGAKGTSDAIIVDVAAAGIEVHDLKFGMGHVVDADHNEQLQVYALGVLDLVEGIYFSEVKTIKLVIHQPRRDHVSEWSISRADLLAFGEETRIAGRTALAMLAGEIPPVYTPSEHACLWCPVKATCEAFQNVVRDAVFAEFGDVPGSDWQELKVKQVKGSTIPNPGIIAMVEDWLSAMKGYIFDELKAGRPAPGWKLVSGKRGNRAWTDPTAVEALVKQIRLKVEEAYTRELKTPAQMEKTVPKKKWELFKAHVGQTDGKPTMAAENDPRPAVQNGKPTDFELLDPEAMVAKIERTEPATEQDFDIFK